MLLVAAFVAAHACEGFFVDVATAPDDVYRYAPSPSCAEAIAAADVDVDAAVRALPPLAQGKAACLLGSPALDDVRRATLHDAARPVVWRARCLVALLPRDALAADDLAFLPAPHGSVFDVDGVRDGHDDATRAAVDGNRGLGDKHDDKPVDDKRDDKHDDKRVDDKRDGDKRDGDKRDSDVDEGRRRVSPIVIAAASYAIAQPSSAARAAAEAALVRVLERALADDALGRWALGDALCARAPSDGAAVQAPACTALRADRARAETRALAKVAGVGGTAAVVTGVGAGALYLVPALLLADTVLALPLGALGGAFAGAVIGGAIGVIVGLPFAAPPAAERLRPGDLGVITLPIAMAADVVNAGVVVFVTTAVGVVVGVAGGAVLGGVASLGPGPARTVTFVAGGVGLAVAVVAVGLGVTWVVAAETDPRE